MKTLAINPKGELTNDSRAQLEVCMMNGTVVPLENNEVITPMLRYVLPVIAPSIGDLDTYIKNVDKTVRHQYTETERKVIAICFNSLEGMPCVTFIFDDEEEPCKYEDLAHDRYAFCYVLNTTSDWCSEFGSCYFDKYKRLG